MIVLSEEDVVALDEELLEVDESFDESLLFDEQPANAKAASAATRSEISARDKFFAHCLFILFVILNLL